MAMILSITRHNLPNAVTLARRCISIDSLNPRTAILDEYVVGQERAKRILSVAVFNHYTRVQANISSRVAATTSAAVAPGQTQGQAQEGSSAETPLYHHHLQEEEEETPQEADDRFYRTTFWRKDASSSQKQDNTLLEKSNVLLMGPTGSGKTLLAKTLANILQVPFSMSDATTFTQAGYVGEDVESVIERLLQSCDYDIEKAEMGIVFVDEIDKIARRGENGVSSHSRDISGEGVQQALLRMLEGTHVKITHKGNGPPLTAAAVVQKQQYPTKSTGATYMGHQLPASSLGDVAPSTSSAKIQPGEVFFVDTSNILFILSGAFVGLEDHIARRMAKSNDTSLAITAKKTGTYLDHVEPDDIMKFGMIPEFVGRLPVLASVNPLSESDLVRVLTEPKNALVKQYEALFQLYKAEIRFTQQALVTIARQAVQKQTGARGLRRIMEDILLDAMFDTPGSSIRHVLINGDVANRKIKPKYYSRGQWDMMEHSLELEDEQQKTMSRQEQ
ncbi:P-loop containing nucleoside triphosphate hydrolase protein [Dichotomocladium elegans]|nr:P-loop containing nucleoside triphosphate hydrolase protein [Dichotomocladium elegans]